MKKLLIAIFALSVSGGVYAQQCKLSNSGVRETPNGKVIARVKTPKSVVVTGKQQDGKGQQWSAVMYGDYDRTAGFEVQVEGWVLSKQLRNCR